MDIDTVKLCLRFLNVQAQRLCMEKKQLADSGVIGSFGVQKRHTSCFIGRSTGRKFRPPRGLSVPKDSELSTSHGEVGTQAEAKPDDDDEVRWF